MNKLQIWPESLFLKHHADQDENPLILFHSFIYYFFMHYCVKVYITSTLLNMRPPWFDTPANITIKILIPVISQTSRNRNVSYNHKIWDMIWTIFLSIIQPEIKTWISRWKQFNWIEWIYHNKLLLRWLVGFERLF